MNRSEVMAAYIALANLVRSFDPGDSDVTPEQISATAHRIILLAEQVKEVANA